MVKIQRGIALKRREQILFSFAEVKTSRIFSKLFPHQKQWDVEIWRSHITAEAAILGQSGQRNQNLNSVSLFIYSIDEISTGSVFLLVYLTTLGKFKAARPNKVFREQQI